MENLGDADKKNVNRMMKTVNDALLAGHLPAVSYPAISTAIIKPLGIKSSLTSVKYKALDLDEFKEWWMSLPLPHETERKIPVQAPKDTSDYLAPIDITPASVVNYRCSTRKQAPLMSTILTAVSEYNHRMTTKEVLEIFAVINGYMGDLRPDELWGTVSNIGPRDYSAWQRAQKTSSFLVGPLTLWNHLKKQNAAYVIEDTAIEGRQRLVYTRNGVTLRCYDRFRVDNPEDTGPMPEAMVDRFLETIKYKGKPVKYSNVKEESYMLAAATLTKYAFKSTKGTISVSLIQPSSANSAPHVQLDGLVADAVDIVVDTFTEHPFEETDAVFIFEKLARLIQAKCPVSEELEEELMGSIGPLNEAMISYVDAFDEIKRATTAGARTTLYQNHFRANTSVDTALLQLKYARDIRNASPASQIVNHNVASVWGTHFPEWVDTMEKGHNIVYALKNKYKLTFTQDDRLTIVGVAYGHMTDALTNTLALSPIQPARVMCIDRVKAKNSPESFVEMDVFLYDEEGRWVIDDANAHTPTDAYYAKFDNQKSTTNGDYVRASNYLRLKSPVIVMKASLNNFRTPAQVNNWMMLWSEYKDYIFRIVKFGKLHNAEVFIILIQTETPQYKAKGLYSDLASVALCVQVANTIIMRWHSAGIRAFIDRQFVASCDSDEGVAALKRSCESLDERSDGDVPYIAPSTVWLALISSLPSAWPWYKAARVDPWHRSGGSELLNVDDDDIVLEDDDGNVIVGHVDVVDPMAPKKNEYIIVPGNREDLFPKGKDHRVNMTMKYYVRKVEGVRHYLLHPNQSATYDPECDEDGVPIKKADAAI